MSMRVGIVAVGVLAPGLDGWQASLPILAGRQPFTPFDVVARTSERLAPAERRRLNTNSRCALAVAGEALDAIPDIVRSDVACVFGSADGDGEVLAQTLASVATSPVAMSPTLFHNSVFNAPAGYCSIAHGLTGASTTLCAGEFTVAVTLLEACDQALADGTPVLCVLVDGCYPESLRGLRPGVPSFAAALVLRRTDGVEPTPWGSIRMELPAAGAAAYSVAPSATDGWNGSSGVTAAALLPLLVAIARRERTALSLAYSVAGNASVDYQP